VKLPKPQPGLVICYSYLWATEHARGVEEGRKDRPCAIVAARQVIEDREIVTVVPVTHTPPATPDDGIEIPAALKEHLGLDSQPSWIIIAETNDFIWPGVDLRPVPGSQPKRFEFGMLPPKFFVHVRDRILRAHAEKRLKQIPRPD